MNKWFALTVAALLSFALAEGDIDVTFTINNVGFNAYVVTEVEGAEVAELNVPNAAWTLEVGKRYRIVNLAGAAHPLLLRGAQAVLLSQRGDGAFADDAEVAFERDEGGMTFTLTEALAQALDTYACAFHPTMTGAIDTGVAREVGAGGEDADSGDYGGYGGGGY